MDLVDTLHTATASIFWIWSTMACATYVEQRPHHLSSVDANRAGSQELMRMDSGKGRVGVAET